MPVPQFVPAPLTWAKSLVTSIEPIVTSCVPEFVIVAS
jgi:hypothetical protein